MCNRDAVFIAKQTICKPAASKKSKNIVFLSLSLIWTLCLLLVENELNFLLSSVIFLFSILKQNFKHSYNKKKRMHVPDIYRHSYL